MGIEPDTKDWTWVLQRGCDECGLDVASLAAPSIGDRIRENARAWPAVLDDTDAAVRPAAHIWSPLEYACHVRDVHRLFDTRLHRMLVEDDPALAGWDQDAAAVEAAYAEQDRDQVARELLQAADAVADRYAGIQDGDWDRTGRRSDGARLSVESWGRYHLHDVVHHLYDVRS